MHLRLEFRDTRGCTRNRSWNAHASLASTNFGANNREHATYSRCTRRSVAALRIASRSLPILALSPLGRPPISGTSLHGVNFRTVSKMFQQIRRLSPANVSANIWNCILGENGNPTATTYNTSLFCSKQLSGIRYYRDRWDPRWPLLDFSRVYDCHECASSCVCEKLSERRCW